MKVLKKIAFLLVGLIIIPIFASEQTVCEGDIKVTKIHKTLITRSGRILITANIEVDENSFSCKGLGKGNTKGIFDDILKQKTSLALGIERKKFKSGVSYHAKYLYPDDYWYDTKHLDLKPLGLEKVTQYKGSLFSIHYPSSFTAKPQTPYSKRYKTVETNEATFLSADKEVAFFVYSPNWTGKPKDYHNILKNETLVSKETKVSYPKKKRKITYTYVTLKAKDGSYMRSYVDILACWASADSCESTTFGIKYKNKKAYDRYKKAYLKFKKSLEKYAAS